jgi:tRNA1(Val) A37 N6-methylase TrmN6
MRNAARIRLGYYPLPLREAERLRRYLRFPESQYSVVDPCAGCGAAAVAIAGGAPSRLYGIELDAYRAEQSSRVLNEVIQGNCFDVHCPVESFSLLYLNPPYDFEVGEGGNQRMEQLFLQQTYRWLKPSGVLLVVIPADRLMTCADVLAVHFRDKAVYRLTETESVRYQQVAVLAIRRTSRERNQVKDSDVALAKRRLADYARRYQELPALPDDPDRLYPVPPGDAVPWRHRGIPLDRVEDLLGGSPAYRQARRLLFSPGAGATGRPLTPLHGGHVGLLATSGLLNGVFGTGPQRHVACWESIKVTDRFEETEEGVTTIRERERFTQSLTLAYADGRTAILADRGKGDEERASTNGNTAVSQDCEGHDN